MRKGQRVEVVEKGGTWKGTVVEAGDHSTLVQADARLVATAEVRPLENFRAAWPVPGTTIEITGPPEGYETGDPIVGRRGVVIGVHDQSDRIWATTTVRFGQSARRIVLGTDNWKEVE